MPYWGGARSSACKGAQAARQDVPQPAAAWACGCCCSTRKRQQHARNGTMQVWHGWPLKPSLSTAYLALHLRLNLVMASRLSQRPTSPRAVAVVRSAARPGDLPGAGAAGGAQGRPRSGAQMGKRRLAHVHAIMCATCSLGVWVGYWVPAAWHQQVAGRHHITIY